MLQIRLLGQFDVRWDGKRVVIPSRAGQSLLAYLALTAGTSHRREKLAGTLWPDTSDENARKNLRQELWRIRKAIPNQSPGTSNDYLLSDEYTLTFNRDADYWLDVAILERPDLDPQSLTSGLSLYQGELLPGFYDDWIVLERERIQTLFESKMERLVEKLVEAERWTAVQEQSERWLALGNTPEPAYRALMLSHSARGDMAKVSSTYQRCVDDLHNQFGVEPSAETHALYNGLLKGARAPRRVVPAQPSGTVTFLFTDIQNSTRLLDKLGEQYATALVAHHKILRAAIQKWNGSEMDTQGDAFFVTFARALDAVQCAAEAQRMLAGQTWPQDEPVRVRMGLHTGEPLITSTGYVGMDVHRAARIGDAGHGGQVLLSQTTRELVINDLPVGITIRDLGAHRLKDLRYPTPIYQLVIEGLPAEFPPIKTKFTGTEAPTPGEPPFKGLQYFETEDSELFFGRELLTAKLVNRLSDTRFLSVIIGASGSGKSSLVRAGLIPALKKGDVLMDGTKPPKGSPDWKIHIITPTAQPLEALATELTRGSESVIATATLLDDLTSDPRSLSLFLTRKDRKGHTLLVVDQFEELFTLCHDEFKREAFIDNLLSAIDADRGRTTLIITLRADFYAHLSQYPELRDAVAKQQEYIGPMTIEELRRAIEEPARRGHWEFEPGLVDLILRDVGDEPGALPLLSHALLETWKRRAGHTLTLKGYADAGGVRGAIAHTAESVYQNLTLEEQAIARNIFLRLTELGEGTEDTRRRASFEELMSHTEDVEAVRAVLNMLADARLVTLSEDTAEVAHEALIREWPTLREWLNQDRVGLQLHRRLTETAREWKLLERDPGVLYRGIQLMQAREWAELHPNALNAVERTFLEASIALESNEIAEREERQRRELEAAQKLAETERQAVVRLRLRNRVITAVGVIAILLAGAALSFSRQSNINARNAEKNAQSALNAQGTAQAEAQSRATQQSIAEFNFANAESQRLAAEASGVLQRGESAELAALLALRGLQASYSSQADAVLQRASHFDYGERLFIQPGSIFSIAVSPDGRSVVTAGSDGLVWLWDIQSGKRKLEFKGHTSLVEIAVFSADGQYLLTSSDDKTVRLWDVRTGQELRQFVGHTDIVKGVAIAPNGHYVLTGSYDGTARLWDLQTGAELRIFDMPGGGGVSFSPDSQSLVIAPYLEPIVQHWEVETGKLLHTLSGHANSSYTAVFSPDGEYILTASIDKTARLWKADTGKWVRTFTGHSEFLFQGVFSPDSKYILTGSLDTTARLWDTSTGEEVRRFTAHTAAVYTVAFSPDGRHVLTGGKDGTVRLWDIQTPAELNTFSGHKSIAFGLAISSDGQYLLTGSVDGSAILWDVPTREQLHVLTSPPRVDTVTISPDNKLILTVGRGNKPRIWDLKTGLELRSFDETFQGAAAFTPDSQNILIPRSDKKSVQLVNAQTGEVLATFAGHNSEPSAAISADGKFVATGTQLEEDGNLRWWEAATGQQLRTFTNPGGVMSVAISPDNRFILAGSRANVVRLWDVETGKLVREFLGHTNIVWSVAFSPNGKYALTASQDKTARLWDVATGEQLRVFPGHGNSSVSGALFAPDGQSVFVSNFDGTIQTTYVDLESLISSVCSRLLRDFTDSERTVYGIMDDGQSCPS